PQTAYQAAKESLAYLGYSLREDNEQSKSLQTHWQPTTSDSHYVEVFNRKDFGTVGAYYYLAVNVIPRGQGSVVTLRNVAKSVISNLKSSRREETRFFGKMADFTRAKDIEVTNIGLQ
ncbi:MAG: hypothetical protein KDK66_06980, partial [Deltaproteobacteria bacterium]|nr:hypothetical protein [Deltaproteobacteria bacterium]